MNKNLLLLLAFVTLGITTRAADGDIFTDGDFMYRVLYEDKHEVELKGCFTKPEGEFTIPSYANNGDTRYSVTCIGPGAFRDCGNLTKVIIPNSVTGIIQNAFRDCWSLCSVTIPNSVTDIESGVFYGCKSLTSVTIPNSVTELAPYTFSGCWSLVSVIIPSSVTKIGADAFSNCIGLPSVTIPNSVTYIGTNAFYSCIGLTSVTIPNSVTYIGTEAFYNCTGLSSVTIPNSVTEMGSWPFGKCTSLQEIIVEEGNSKYKSIDGVLYDSQITQIIGYPGGKKGEYEIPNSVTEISGLAFEGCISLTSLDIPNSVIEIGGYAFQDCTGLHSVTIPNSVTEIGGSAFKRCTSLKSIAIPNSVNIINSYTFEDCINLTLVSIPNSITYIEGDAFKRCKSLTSVIIPKSLIAIRGSAFFGCESLTTIVALPTTPPPCGPFVFDDTPKTAVVYIPKGTLEDYSVASGWDYYSDFREMGVLDITLSESELTIDEGESVGINVSITRDEDVTIESRTWTTSNPEVARVDDGLVTGVAEGLATISYTVVDCYGLSHTAICDVEVVSPSGIDNVTVDGDNAPVEFFNLNGVSVNANNLIPGIYIKCQGGKASKVVVR